jgi:hypothetical protein
MPKEKIFALEEVLEPSQFVRAYKDLAASDYVGRLAPSLGLVVTRKLYDPTVGLSSEFTDPEIFIGITHFSDAMVDALKLVNRGLQSSSGTVTLSLTLEMGFGKTHFLTLLWHLYTEIPRIWSEIQRKPVLEDAVDKLTRNSFYKWDIAQKTLTLAIDLKRAPKFMLPYEAIFDTCAAVAKEYNKLQNFKGVKEPEFEKLVRSLAKREPTEAAKEFAKEINEIGATVPILILLDELYAAVFETVEGADKKTIESYRNLFIFLLSFIDEVAEFNPVVLVYASAHQDLERWNRLKKVKDRIREENPDAYRLIEDVDHFESRTSRKLATMKQVKSEDVMDIVIKRLIQFRGPREEAAREVVSGLSEVVADRLGKSASTSYYKELMRTYPFTPTYGDFVEKLLAPTIGGDLPRTQHIRDLLKITSALVGKVCETEEWKRISLISPAYLTHEDVNHLMDERYSMEWGRLFGRCQQALTEIGDEKVRSLCERMLSVVYIKSLTTNVSKLIDMVKSPEVLPRNEVLTRGTSAKDLMYSLVGAVPQELLLKFDDANEQLLKAPYVIDVKYAGEKYLVISFAVNPLELIESFKNEEIFKFRPPGGKPEEIVKKTVGYFMDHLEREYAIASKFSEVGDKPDNPKLSLVDYNVLISERKREKPKFVDYLDRDKFTTLVITPWSSVERKIEEKEPVDLAEEVKTAIQGAKNDIAYPNMFAVVVPDISVEILDVACTKIAEVRAAARVVEYFQPKEVEEARKRRIELAKRAPSYPTLLELLRGEEREWEDIIVELMDALQKRIEEYAKSYTDRAVHDYAGQLTGIFKNVIFFDPVDETFKKGSLEVSGRAGDKLKDIYGELPVWIARAIMSRCAIARQDTIRSYILENFINPIVEQYKEIDRKKIERIKIGTLPEQMMRGWRKIPLKPLSRREIDNAIKLTSGTASTLKARVKYHVEGEGEARQIVIELEPIKLPPPPPPGKRVSAIGIEGRDNVKIGFELLADKSVGPCIASLDLNIGLEKGSVRITDIDKEVAERILGNLMDILDGVSDRIRSVSFSLKLREETLEEGMVMEALERTGVSLEKVKLEGA